MLVVFLLPGAIFRRLFLQLLCDGALVRRPYEGALAQQSLLQPLCEGVRSPRRPCALGLGVCADARVLLLPRTFGGGLLGAAIVAFRDRLLWRGLDFAARVLGQAPLLLVSLLVAGNVFFDVGFCIHSCFCAAMHAPFPLSPTALFLSQPPLPMRVVLLPTCAVALPPMRTVLPKRVVALVPMRVVPMTGGCPSRCTMKRIAAGTDGRI
jgi:hypothetical protein